MEKSSDSYLMIILRGGRRMTLESFDEKLKAIDSQIDVYVAVNEKCRERGIQDKDIIIAIYREVATDLRGAEIREEQESRRFVTVRVRDGEELRTVDVKEELKRLNFKFDADKKLWYRKMRKRTWDQVKENRIFGKLKVEVVER